MPKIHAKNISHSFDSKLVLDTINLTIDNGELMSLVGASGCGKSTLLRILSKLIKPSNGEIEDSSSDELKISMVFQDANLLPWLSVLGNVSLPLKLKGESSNKPIEWLKKVGLGDSMNLYPDQLSGGMKMRVALARAMVIEPDLVLLDEPFAALDEITRQEMGDELLQFRKISPCTTVFVTHSVAEAVYLSNNVALMSSNPGKIVTKFPINSPTDKDKAWRTDLQYTNQVTKISNALQTVMEGGVIE
jgi:NitT/TauT family transport system ATP-binding protein